MPTNYEHILRDNLHEYGHGARHLAFLGQLYTDRTHFVYELLQNAEDARATRVKFLLRPDGLEIMHDGRLFDERDVRGVCGVGGGTKEKDFTQIGKFGIGFKSVYAFTATPEIHSGDEDFCIESYIRPRRLEPQTLVSPWTTLFRFPFDHSDIAPDTAFREITSRLQRLGLRTLLFLKSVGEIQWEVVGEGSGTYLREISPLYGGDRVLLLGSAKGTEAEENWLVYRRPVRLGDRHGRVEIAFQLKYVDRGSDEDKSRLTIARLCDSPLVVYFPTEKPTRLGFLVQGPYRTTPARDNIAQNDDWNGKLVEETAELLLASLRTLRENNLLTIDLFESLPIQPDAFPEESMFRPLFDRVAEALADEPLLPTADGRTTNGRNAVLARGGGLLDLLSPSQLRQLLQCESEPQWLTTKITQDRTPVLHRYLLQTLEVREVTSEVLARQVTEEFFGAQSDAWMVQFYGYLLRQEALWVPRRQDKSEGPLRRQPFLRLSTGEHVVPFQSDDTPAAFLPSVCDLNVPFVKRSIADDEQANDFLRRLGLGVPDVVDEVINTVLPKYRADMEPDSVDSAEYASDLRAIATALHTDSAMKRGRIIEQARKTPFILAQNAATGALAFRPPIAVYLRSRDLSLYLSGNEQAWFLLDSDSVEALQPADFEALGIAERPRRIAFEPDLTSEEKYELRNRTKATREEAPVDYKVDGLAEALARIVALAGNDEAVELARVVWNAIRQNCGECWTGRYEWFYSYQRRATFPASFLKRLTATAWIPDRTGVFHRPGELDVSELSGDWPLNDEVIQQLGLGNAQRQEAQWEEDHRQAYASELGVDLSDIEVVLANRDEFIRWRDAVVASRSAKTEFPERPAANPARRVEGILESLERAPAKTYAKRERTVRVSVADSEAVTWLRNQYTNDDGEMVCQICEQKMPFKKRNGEYYFEAVELTPDADFEHGRLYIALCPVCAAKYKEFIKNDEEALVELERGLTANDSQTVRLKLGDESTSLRFVETHWLDVRTLLATCSV